MPYKMPAGAFYASNSTIQSKGLALKAFLAAWKEAAAAAVKHPQFTRSIIPKYTGISQDIAQKITPPIYTVGVPPSSLGPMLQAMKKFGWIGGIPSYGTFVWNGR